MLERIEMKKIILTLFTLLLLTGCFKSDNFEDVTIYTTVYPIEYVVDYLYGDSSTINSIYPRDESMYDYELNDKQLKDYSSADLYVYNGLFKEADYAVDMLAYNKIKLSDSTMGMEIGDAIEESWLNPADMIMIARNIKNALFEYIKNPYVEDKIEDKYQELKIDLSNLDVEMQLASQRSDHKTIITSDNAFNYLSKYGLNDISLHDDGDLIEKDIVTAIDLLKTKTVKYIYLMNGQEQSDIINRVLNESNAEIIYLDKFDFISSADIKAGKTYFDISLDNIDKIKQGL